MFLWENTVFDMATSGVTEGCLYAVVFQGGTYNYVRFSESGIFKGFSKVEVSYS